MVRNDYQKLFFKVYMCIRRKHPEWSKKRIASSTKYCIRYGH